MCNFRETPDGDFSIEIDEYELRSAGYDSEALFNDAVIYIHFIYTYIPYILKAAGFKHSADSYQIYMVPSSPPGIIIYGKKIMDKNKRKERDIQDFATEQTGEYIRKWQTTSEALRDEGFYQYALRKKSLDSAIETAKLLDLPPYTETSLYKYKGVYYLTISGYGVTEGNMLTIGEYDDFNEPYYEEEDIYAIEYIEEHAKRILETNAVEQLRMLP